MNAQEINALRESTAADFEARAKAKRAALLDSANVGKWLAVSADGMALAFDIDARGNVSNPRVTTSISAPTFDRHTAERLGRMVQNGRSETGGAASLMAMLEKEAAGLEKNAALIRRIPPAV